MIPIRICSRYSPHYVRFIFICMIILLNMKPNYFFSTLRIMLFNNYVFFAESVWVKPKEGFMSLEEYEKLNQQAIQQKEKQDNQDFRYSVDNADEIAAKLKRERLRAYKVDEDKVPDEDAPILNGPAARAAVYGEWQTVVKRWVNYFTFNGQLNSIYYTILEK